MNSQTNFGGGLVKKIFDNWLTSLASLVLVALIIIGGYHFAFRPNMDPIPGANGGTSAGVPSDSCILCHTDESVISASTVGQEEVEEASGG